MRWPPKILVCKIEKQNWSDKNGWSALFGFERFNLILDIRQYSSSRTEGLYFPTIYCILLMIILYSSETLVLVFTGSKGSIGELEQGSLSLLNYY